MFHITICSLKQPFYQKIVTIVKMTIPSFLWFRFSQVTFVSLSRILLPYSLSLSFSLSNSHIYTVFSSRIPWPNTASRHKENSRNHRPLLLPSVEFFLASNHQDIVWGLVFARGVNFAPRSIRALIVIDSFERGHLNIQSIACSRDSRGSRNPRVSSWLISLCHR